MIQLLRAARPELECRAHIITTTGDCLLDRHLPGMDGKGLFTSELEDALLSGKVTAAVHSLKEPQALGRRLADSVLERGAADLLKALA